MEISVYLSAVIVLAAVFIQSTLASYLSFNFVHPNLVLVIVTALSFLRPPRESVTLAFIAGALLDLLTGFPFGIFTLSLILTALLASFWHSNFNHSFSYLLPVFLVLPYSIAFNIVVAGLLWLADYPAYWGNILRYIIIPVSLYNVALMAVVYPLLYWFNHLFKREALSISG